MTTILIALVAAACNGENPLAINDLVDDEQLGECPELLSAIREEAAAEVGPYGLGQSGPLGMQFGGDAADIMFEMPFGPMNQSGASGPRAMLAGRPGGEGAEALLVVVSDNRLYVIDTATAALVGSTSLGVRSSFTSGMRTDRTTAATLSVTGPTATVVFHRVADPPDELRLPVDPFGTATAGAIVRVDLTDPAAPVVAETLHLGGAIGALTHSVDLADGDTGAESQVSFGVTGSAPPLPLVQPVNRTAEDTAEAVNRKVVAESTLEDWVPHYALERAGEIVASGPASGCALQRMPDSSLGSSTALAVRLPAEGALVDLDAVSIVGTQGVTVAGDYLIALSGGDESGVDFQGFHWTADGLDSIGRVRTDGFVDSMPLAVGNGRALARSFDWTAGPPETATVLFDASDRGLRLEHLGSGSGQGFNIGEGRPVDALRVGSLLVSTGSRGVEILEVSAKGDVEKTGSVEVGAMTGRLQPLDGQRVLFVGSVDQKGTVLVIDVSDPADPVVRSRTAVDWVAEGEAADAVYNADSGTLVAPRMQLGTIAGTLQVLAEHDGGFEPTGIVPFEADEPPNVGDTACEEIELDRIENQLEMFGEGGSLNVLCTEPGASGVIGHVCTALPEEVFDPDVAERFGFDQPAGPGPDREMEQLRQAVADGARVESCQPWGFERGITPDFMAMVDGRVLAVAGPQVRVGDVDGFELIDTINLQPPAP